MVEATPELLKAAALARAVFLGAAKNEPVLWPPPIVQPHFSLAYGTNPHRAAELPLPEEWTASELALVRTQPATLEGAPLWSEVTRVSLLQ